MTGGFESGNIFSSTEVFLKGGSSWTVTGNSLPTRMWGIGSVSYNNQIFVIGEIIILNKMLFIFYFICIVIIFSGGRMDSGLAYEKVLLYDEDSGFVEIGKLSQARYANSVSIVTTTDFNCS